MEAILIAIAAALALCILAFLVEPTPTHWKNADQDLWEEKDRYSRKGMFRDE